MIASITKVFDTFIHDTGGNLDPRSGCNRDRIALYKFWKALNQIGLNGKHNEHIERCIKELLKRKLVFSDFKSDEKFVVYDYLGNKVEDSDTFLKEDTTAA